MKVAAFLHLRNEIEKGHLLQCLNNTKQWADDIFIYDDASTDSSQDIYLKFTSDDKIIFGKSASWKMEGFHKAELLKLVLSHNPDWIVWQDGDEILDRTLTTNMKQILSDHEGHGYLKVHLLNLWRHPAYHRTDGNWNSVMLPAIWRNTGSLKFNPSEGLHRAQWPEDMQNEVSLPYHILHYAYTSKRAIVRKYLDYKAEGLRGMWIDRIADESSMSLSKVPKEIYPVENVPGDYETATPPEPCCYDEYFGYANWQDCQNAVGDTL